MKKRSISRPSVLRAFRIAALLGLSAGLLPAARAVTYTWTGNGASFDITNWSYTPNWVGGRPVSSTNTELVFGSPGSSNAPGNSNDIADPFTLRSLTFTVDATHYLLSGGRLNFNGAGAGATLTSNTAETVTINNALTASDNLAINLGPGSGQLNLAGGLSTTGATISINAGTVIGNANVLSGNISGRAALNITGSADFSTLVLTGNNTYTQGTILTSGTLSLSSAGAIGSTGAITFSGGSLRFTAANTTDYSSRFVSQGGAFSIDTNGQNVTFASVLSDGATPGAIRKLGPGTLTLTATNTYTGGTFVDAGTLVALNNGRAISRGPAVISSGAILALSNTNTATPILQAPTTFTGTGVLQKTGAGNVQFGGNGGLVNVRLGAGGFIDVQAGTLSGSSSFQGIWTDNLGGLNIASGATFDGVEGAIVVDALTGSGTLKGGYGSSGSTTIGVNNGAGTFAGVIANSGDNNGKLSLIKAGTGIETLLGNNTYTGTTTINSGGALQVGNNTPTGSLGTGAVIVNGTLAFDRSDNVTVANAISGTGGIAHIGGSTLTLTGNNTYAGLTVIGGGNGTSTLQVGNGGTAGSVGTGGIIDNGVLAINHSDGLTLANPISGSGGLVKLGSGTLILTGANTYTGTTTINAGTLAIGSASALGSGGEVIVAGGLLSGFANLTLDHSISFAAGATSTVAAAPDTTLALGVPGGSTQLSALGNLIFGVAGQTGTVVLQNQGLSIQPGFALSVNAGTVRNGFLVSIIPSTDLTSLASVAGSTTVATGATLDFANGTSGGAGGLTVANLQGAGLVTGGTSPSAVLAVGAGNFSGVISGESSLSKMGSGTLALSGENTFTGGTTIRGGTLQIGNAQALALSTLTVSSTGGTLAFTSGLGGFAPGGLAGNGNVALTDVGGNGLSLYVGRNGESTTYSGVLSGGGSLTKQGTGTLTLTGTNTYAYGTYINGGTLSVSRDANLGAASGYVSMSNVGQLLVTGTAFTTGRTFYLGNDSLLTPAPGATITYAGADIHEGILGAGGTHIFANGTTIQGARAVAGSALSQASGTVAFNFLNIAGSLTQTGGTLNLLYTTLESTSSLTVGGTINTDHGTLSGLTTVNNGGTISNTNANLNISGRTTVNAGGALTTAGNVSIEVNNATLVNNGTLSGLVNINSGSLFYGAGNASAATLSVNRGGQYGNNTSAVGGTGNALTTVASSISPFWAALDRGEHAPNPLPFIGPQVATTPQVVTVASLALGQGSTLNFNLQNTQLPAGQGSDLTYTGVGGLLLTGSATTGNQITIRLISLDTNGNNGAAANFDPSQNYAFTLVNSGGRLLGYTPGEFAVNTASFTNNTQGGVFSVVQQGNNLVLVFTAVPEPATWVALLGGAALLGLVLRRRGRVG